MALLLTASLLQFGSSFIQMMGQSMYVSSSFLCTDAETKGVLVITSPQQWECMKM